MDPGVVFLERYLTGAHRKMVSGGNEGKYLGCYRAEAYSGPCQTS